LKLEHCNSFGKIIFSKGLSKLPWVLPVFRPVALLALDTGLPKLHRRFHQTMKP